MVAILVEIDAALAPIIGSRGVAALYDRSLHLTASAHPWLTGGNGSSQTAIDLSALKSAVVLQNGPDAALGGSALLQTFHQLLGSLIGPSLIRQLLPGLWASCTSKSHVHGTPESHLDGRRSALLLEANQQLVLSALRSRRDAEAAAEALERASRSAGLDALTGLPNRMLLLDRLAQAISSAKRHGCRSALLFLDLNNFKQINDTAGHAAGDQVLKLAARRLASSVRAADTVSRHGGDEFLILLAEVGAACDATAIADKLSNALGMPSRVGNQVIRLTASIGISLYPDDGEDAVQLIDRADAAMYCAKRHGLHCLVFRGELGEQTAMG